MDFSTTVTRLLTALALLRPPSDGTSSSAFTARHPNILTRLTQPSASAAKHIFLTLHFLFPHDLLPALDLLDRGLVTCFATPPSPSIVDSLHLETTTRNTQPIQASTSASEVYYIQSASAVTDNTAPKTTTTNTSTNTTGIITTASAAPNQTRGRYRNALRPKPTDTFYEVRLDSWNCSCAAFAFSALKLLSLQPEQAGGAGHAVEGGSGGGAGRGEGRREVGTTGLRVGGHSDDRNINIGINIVANDEPSPEPRDRGATAGEGPAEFRFGGTLTQPGAVAPVCKHILAACVAKYLPGWAWGGSGSGEAPGRRVGEGRDYEGGEGAVEVSWQRVGLQREEVAGWGGGWGDR